MGNSCCSNEGRKGKNQDKRVELGQYEFDHQDDESGRQFRFSHQKGYGLRTSIANGGDSGENY
jgi:hypothetical protein